MIQPLDSVILRTLLVPLVAAVELFAVYVVVHGHYSPGGGFQGGTLLGCAMILPTLVLGGRRDQPLLSDRGAAALAAVGVLIFTAFGLVAMLNDQPMLDYAAVPLHADPATRRSLAILGIEVGVTLGVAGAVASIFFSLFGETEEQEERRRAREERNGEGRA